MNFSKSISSLNRTDNPPAAKHGWLLQYVLIQFSTLRVQDPTGKCRGHAAQAGYVSRFGKIEAGHSASPQYDD